jgi:hypothetical protein
MKRIVGGVLVALVITVGMTGSAQAATGRVLGTNSYKKLAINNDTTTLTFKLFAPGGKCSVKYLKVVFTDRKGTTFSVDGGCYPGAVWIRSLSKGDDLVKCSGYTLTYNKTAGFWLATVPRSCLVGLGPAIKVTDSWVDDYSPMPGEAGPSGWIAQG